jgi:hypothetical protein
MNSRAGYVAGLWCTPIAVVILFAGMWLLGGFIPPPSPAMTAEATAAMYAANPFGIKLTAILVIATPALLAPLTAIISVLMWRGEGRHAPLALTQLVAGVMTIAPFILTGLCWAVAAFRTQRDPALIELMNDFGWISLEMVTPPAMIELAALGLGILLDRSAKPVFPRWLAYYSFWTSLLFLPGLLVSFFLSGPFAWNGLLSFWVAAGAYGSWLLVMFYVCLQAVRRDDLG